MDFRIRLAVLTFFASGGLAGCNHSAEQLTPEMITVRAKYLLADEPVGALGVLDVQESIEQQGDYVVVGQIGGLPDPWSPGLASFVISDPFLEMEGEHSKPCDCHFCSKEKDHSTGVAQVQFHDESGEVLRLDARKLFGLKEKQTVVVRGHVTLNSLGVLTIAAEGMYIRR